VITKLNFQQPLLQSSVSHDPSKIILDSLMNKKFKRTVFIWKINLL